MMKPGDMIGQVLNGYRLERSLGSGTFGTVYLARHVDLDRLRAIKVAREARFVELVRAEGRLLDALRHPNVVRLYEMDTTADPAYVNLEYVPGGDLRKALGDGPMPPQDVLALALQLLEGLSAAHELGILHRDIKPSNILLGEGDVVKLADFGLGRVAAQESLLVSGQSGNYGGSQVLQSQGSKTGSHSSEIVGTIAYMSPEQRRGEELDARSDLFSLGVVLYEALTRRLPEGRFKLPGELLEGVPSELDSLVDVLLAPEAEDRPGSAQDARDLLSGAARARRERETQKAREVEEARKPEEEKRRALLKPGSHAGEETTGPDGGTYVWVPAGEFMMGSTDRDIEHAVKYLGAQREWVKREQPAHEVRISKGFWLAKHQVTNARYRAFCESTGKTFPEKSDQGDDHPVLYVGWVDAKAYCCHYGMTLPTEAQWEYAARGPEGHKYPWGDEWDSKKCCNRDNQGPGGRTFPVGSFPEGANWCGALDMAGNVWEWCSDWYDESYYASSPDTDPAGPATGTLRLLRGGSWYDGGISGDLCRSAARSLFDPVSRMSTIGFRCVRTP